MPATSEQRLRERWWFIIVCHRSQTNSLKTIAWFQCGYCSYVCMYERVPVHVISCFFVVLSILLRFQRASACWPFIITSKLFIKIADSSANKNKTEKLFVAKVTAATVVVPTPLITHQNHSEIQLFCFVWIFIRGRNSHGFINCVNLTLRMRIRRENNRTNGR